MGVHAECTMVNFTVTPNGLEEQLLALVVRKERPDLATQKTELVHQQHHFRLKLAKLEEEILNKLATAKGDITQDRELIESLEKTKVISGEILVKVKESEQTTEEITKMSENYRHIAARGSLMFFIMNNLYKVHMNYV